MDDAERGTTDRPGDAGAGVTVTLAVREIATPLIVAETVLVSATVERKAPVAAPLASVGLLGWVSVFPLPEAARTTAAPGIGVPPESFATLVIVAEPVPA